MHALRKSIAAVAMVAAMMAGGIGVAASPAGASATGCSITNSGGKTTYCVLVSGTGLHVSYVIGSYSSLSTVCNWTISAEFFDTSNHWYKTFTSSVHKGCWFANSTQLNTNYNAKAGKVYSTLKSNGSRITSVGFSVHP